MAIAPVGGTAANNSGSVASLALPSYTSHTGDDIYVAIALGSTASSISSITNSAGSYSGVAMIAGVNAASMRTELWKLHVGTGAATVFTVNIGGGNTSVAAALEEYSGVSSNGHNGTNSGSSINLESPGVATQDINNYVVAAMGFACQSGDTLTALLGNSRQSSIPAATAVGVAIYDVTCLMQATITDAARILNSRDWASVANELRSGSGAAVPAIAYAATTAPTLQTITLLGNRTDLVILGYQEPMSCQAAMYLSNSGTGNWGFVQ